MSSITRSFHIVLCLSLVACAPDESVVITHDVLYLAGTASPVSRPVSSDQRIVSARAIGGSTSYDATIGADGSVSFANVPTLPIDVLLTYASDPTAPDAPAYVVGFPLSSRRARIGDVHLGRPDVAPATMASTRIALHATALAAWETDSEIGLFSRSADVWAYLETGDDPSETAAPSMDATSIDGWSFGALTMTLPYGGSLPLFDTARGDDLTVYRRDTASLPATSPAPWDHGSISRVTQYGSVESATASDGATTSVTTALTSSTSSFALDYHASEFVALRGALGVPDDVGVDVYVSLVHEGGAGPDYFNAVTPAAFDVATSTSFVPDDPTCFPDDMGMCDTSACPSGCNDATHRVDPGDFTTTIDTVAPFGLGRDVLFTSVTWYQPWADAAGMNHTIDRRVMTYQPAMSGRAVHVVIAPPLHIRIDGTELPIVAGSASIASATPTITWDPPTQGTAGFYRVDLVAQRTFTLTTGAASSGRNVASFYTLEPTLTVPSGVLVAGADYFARVTANAASWEESNIGQPGGSDASLAYNASGVFHH